MNFITILSYAKSQLSKNIINNRCISHPIQRRCCVLEQILFYRSISLNLSLIRHLHFIYVFLSIHRSHFYPARVRRYSIIHQLTLPYNPI